MAATTKIDWADATWNPVTGCYHDCPYCYARGMANRFGGGVITGHDHLYDLDKPAKKTDGTVNPYPYGFDPTFHRYRLNIPHSWKKPRNIFVCSMADLFGDWVPEEWIQEVFKACEAAPQHNYLFLTKNPTRLQKMYNASVVQSWNQRHPGNPHPQTNEFSQCTTLPGHKNWWWGSTITDKNGRRFQGGLEHTFISIEPLLGPLNAGLGSFGSADWIIIGAETGNRKGKVVPKKEWVMNIVEAAGITHAAVFMKESLRDIMGDDFRQEFPFKKLPVLQADGFHCPKCGKRLGDNQVYLYWPCECGQRLDMYEAKRLAKEAVEHGDV